MTVGVDATTRSTAAFTAAQSATEVTQMESVLPMALWVGFIRGLQKVSIHLALHDDILQRRLARRRLARPVHFKDARSRLPRMGHWITRLFATTPLREAFSASPRRPKPQQEARSGVGARARCYRQLTPHQHARLRVERTMLSKPGKSQKC